MEKQYSVKFFASFLEALQKVCRDFVDFDDSVELSGYLSLEIDNVKKERYVLSEMLNSSGNVISESYCTKAFKTVRKYQQPPSGRENITPRTHTVTNRSQRDQHHGFMSESQNPNSSPLFNFKDHSSESRIPKQWGQDMYGQNSQMSPLHGSGHQYGDSGGIHTMKSSNQKRSVPTILIDDLPSNKRVRSDSLPDDKLLTETISPPVKVDTASAMQMSFSDTSQSVAHLSSTTTTSSSLISSHTNNYTSSNTSTSQANSESIRLPLPVTIKDEPDIPCVDIDLSELDSVDSMGGGSDSGSGYPSADGTSGTYRMGGNVQGTPESYQVNTSLSSMNPAIFLTSLVDERSLIDAEMRAGASRDPSGTLLNLLIDLVFTQTELANSSGLGLRFRHTEDPNKKPLDSAKVDAIKEYVHTLQLQRGWEIPSPRKLNKKFTNKVCHARRDLRHGHTSDASLADNWMVS